MLSPYKYQEYLNCMFPAYAKATDLGNETLKQSLYDDAVCFIQKNIQVSYPGIEVSIDCQKPWHYNVSKLDREYFYSHFSDNTAAFVYQDSDNKLFVELIVGDSLTEFDYLLSCYHYLSLFHNAGEIANLFQDFQDRLYYLSESFFTKYDGEKQAIIDGETFQAIKNFIFIKNNKPVSSTTNEDDELVVYPIYHPEKSDLFVSEDIYAPIEIGYSELSSRSNHYTNFLKLPLDVNIFELLNGEQDSKTRFIYSNKIYISKILLTLGDWCLAPHIVMDISKEVELVQKKHLGADFVTEVLIKNLNPDPSFSLPAGDVGFLPANVMRHIGNMRLLINFNSVSNELKIKCMDETPSLEFGQQVDITDILIKMYTL